MHTTVSFTRAFVHTARLMGAALTAASDVGFEIESVERLKWGIVERVVARKPGGEPGIAAAAT